MRKPISALLILAYLVLAGCNTMAGVGRDIERGGEKLQNSAERNK
jgi:entericidin B